MQPRVDNIFGVTSSVKSGQTEQTQKTKNNVQTFNYVPTEDDKMRGLQVEKSNTAVQKSSVSDIPVNEDNIRDASGMDISKMDLPIEDFLRLKIDENTILSKEQKMAYERKLAAQRLQGWRFETKEDFENVYITTLKDLAKRCGEENIYNLYADLSQVPITKPVTMEGVKMVLEAGGYNIELEGVEFPADTDWTQSKEVFKYLTWDDKTFAKIPKENFPADFNPQTVFENGKNLGLGLDDVHEMGYTGKGVSIAIMDWTLKPHEDITSEVVFKGKHAQTIPEYMHASAVNSILSGKTVGVAPGADTYHFDEYENPRLSNGGRDMIDALKALIEKNKSLPEDKKIRVVSISGPIYGGEEAENLVKELNDSGVWVLDSGTFWENFGYLGKKDPMASPDDFDNYQIERGVGDTLYVNSGDRTVASPDGENTYRHDSRASASWAIPVVAGYYALACQADPSMTPDRFIELAHQTAQIKESNKYIDLDDPTKGRTEETVPIKIIDIKALIKEIEAQKAKN